MKYEPFKIPAELLSEWRKIGKKASQKFQKNKINFSNLENLDSFKKLIVKEKLNILKIKNLLLQENHLRYF